MLATLLAVAALAENSAADYAEVDDDSMMVEAYGMTVEELEDLDVFTADGVRIGEVEEALVDSTGTVSAVAVEFEGFTGLKDKEVIVRLDALTLDGTRLITDLDESEAASLPRWD